MEILILVGIVWVVYVWANKGSGSQDKPLKPPPAVAPNYRPESATNTRSNGRSRNDESNTQLVERAIRSGVKVRFRYIDQQGELTERSVTPLYLERRHAPGVLCLVAHCHLRGAQRTFVVSRMQRVSIV